MGDRRKASDVPDDFRRAFIDAYHAEMGDWPSAMAIYAAWNGESPDHTDRSSVDSGSGGA